MRSARREEAILCDRDVRRRCSRPRRRERTASERASGDGEHCFCTSLPFKQTHHSSSTEGERCNSTDAAAQARLAHGGVVDEVAGEQLDEGSVEEDTSTDGVQDTESEKSTAAVGVAESRGM